MINPCRQFVGHPMTESGRVGRVIGERKTLSRYKITIMSSHLTLSHSPTLSSLDTLKQLIPNYYNSQTHHPMKLIHR